MYILYMLYIYILLVYINSILLLLLNRVEYDLLYFMKNCK